MWTKGSKSDSDDSSSVHGSWSDNVFRYHWIHNATAYNHAYEDAGLFCIHASAHPSHLADLTQIITRELSAMNGRMGKEELEVRCWVFYLAFFSFCIILDSCILLRCCPFMLGRWPVIKVRVVSIHKYISACQSTTSVHAADEPGKSACCIWGHCTAGTGNWKKAPATAFHGPNK